MIGGKTTSTQIGFDPTTLRKLHSFLVAADAACSKGDLPVAAVEAMLAAVIGLATAAAPTADPAELAAAVPVAPRAAIGATQPVVIKRDEQANNQASRFGCFLVSRLFFLANRSKYSSRPSIADYGFKFAIRTSDV